MKKLFLTFNKRQFRSGGFITGLIIFGGMMAFFPAAFAESGLQTAGAMVGTGMAFSIILGWGLTFSSIKNSAIMNGIVTSNLSKNKFMIVSTISAAIMAIVSAVVLVGLMLLFIGIGEITGYEGLGPQLGGRPGVPYTASETIKGIQWGKMIGGIVLTAVMSSSIAFLFSNIFSNPIHINTAAWIYAVALFFFGGASAPIGLIRGIGEGDGGEVLAVFKYIGWFVPNSYSNFVLADAASGVNNALINAIPEIDNIINPIVPVLISTVFVGIGMWRWNR